MGFVDIRIGIIGGSIAGCAMAMAARFAGADVVVYERSAGRLEERGFGIGMPQPLRATLIAAGYVDPGMPAHPMSERVWITKADGGDERVLWRQPSPVMGCNWGLLWQALRDKIAEGDYRAGITVERIESDGAAPGLVTRDATERFDCVIGADGYRSLARAGIDGRSEPHYAGYGLWRASYPEAALPVPVPELETGFATVVFPNGHAVFYFIPDAPPPRGTGGRRLNWGVYAYPPSTPRSEHGHPPGSAPELATFVKALATQHFPRRWTQLIEATADTEIAMHPVYDLSVSAYTRGRLALAGDAGALARPHTASGAVKAIDDALTFQRALREAPSLPAALADYNESRCAEGNRLTALGRRIGHAQVEETPDWSRMDAPAMADWTRHTLAGTGHYLYADPGEPPARA
ncbi:FAD-dependent monooxygenase [Nocardia sp. NPDC127526]|uniref:FAD-dependent monooxygenase n=1 Tax=Nocardia sp. NPDC127526 TaxID=3345393 RepID=UPI00362C7184